MAYTGPTKDIITDKTGRPLMNPENTLQADRLSFVVDADWAKSAFLVSDVDLNDKDDVANRYWSSSDAKFTSTQLGGNIGINPKPQYTRYADVRKQGRVSGRNKVTLTDTIGNYGMGRYYSEAIDDPSQRIYMSFGVEQYNSLTNFLTRAFSYTDTTLARTGRAPGILYQTGKAIGTYIDVVTFPAAAALVGGLKALNWVFSKPTSKFYTMKRDMFLYYSAVQSLVNNIAANMGIYPKSEVADIEKGQRLGQPYQLDQEHMNMLAAMMPDVFPRWGSDNKAKMYFDVYAIANKAQRMANLAFAKDYEELNQNTASKYTGYLKKEATGNGSHTTYVSNANGTPSWGAYFNRMASFSFNIGNKDEARMEMDPRVVPDDPSGTAKRNPSFFDEVYKNLDADFRDGNQFAIFNVNHSGPVSDQFSTAVMESQISSKLNTISSEMRQATFAFANGNLIGGIAGDAIGTVTNAVKDVAMGVLDGVTMGFSNILPGLGGGGYIDIPKHYQSSTAQLGRIQYTMHLMAPHGNPISRLMNIFIPLSMILAGALPRSVGSSSYTSPFLCQIFDRGRCQIKLGMIEAITINRGVSHLAFDLKGNALAFEVSFTVVDLSSIMHMPISTGTFFSHDAGLDEDNILADYLAVLAGQDLYSQMYAMPKAKLRLAKLALSGTKFTSPAYWASAVHDSATSGMLKYLTLGSTTLLEGLARQPEVTTGSIQ